MKLKTYTEFTTCRNKLWEATNLSASELSKPNSITKIPRIDILRSEIKAGNPLETVKGEKVIVSNINDALEKIEIFSKEKNPQSFELITNVGNISIRELAKNEIFGGRISGAGGGTKNTALAESLQCVYLQAMLESGNTTQPDFYTKGILKAAFKKVKVGKTTWKDILTLDRSWFDSAYKSSVKLIKMGYVHKGMILHRDSTFMQEIYNTKSEIIKRTGLRNFPNDKWNPADIWAVSGKFKFSQLDKTSLKGYNTDIEINFTTRNLVGISLKKVTRDEGIAKEFNVGDPRLKDRHVITDILLHSKGKEIFSRQDAEIKFDSEGIMTIKPNSAFGVIKAEIKSKGSRGGSAGWGVITSFAKTYLNETIPSWGKVQEFYKKIQAEVDDKKRIKMGPNTIKMWNLIRPFTDLKKQEFLDGLKKVAPKWISSKLGAVLVISLIEKHGGTKANKFVTELVKYAGSNSDESSSFVKIF